MRITVVSNATAVSDVPAANMIVADSRGRDVATCSSGESSVAFCHLRCIPRFPSSSSMTEIVVVIDMSALYAVACQNAHVMSIQNRAMMEAAVLSDACAAAVFHELLGIFGALVGLASLLKCSLGVIRDNSPPCLSLSNVNSLSRVSQISSEDGE